MIASQSHLCRRAGPGRAALIRTLIPALIRTALHALLAAACIAALPARAHKPSDAYLQLQLGADGRVEQRLDVALRDLDRELDLDADGDGRLTWGELRGRWDALQRLADAGVQLQADGRACTVLAHGAPQLDDHVDGRYAVLRRSLQCAAAAGAPSALTLDYRLFARSDATHRGLARIDRPSAAAPLSRVLVPGSAPLALGWQATAAADGRAHAASDTASDTALAGFYRDGLRHIAEGADHLLFLVTLLLVAVWRRQGEGWVPRDAARSAWREALHLVTAFTLAHSLTLGLAAAGVLAPPARWVESLIALSVLVAALDNLRPFLPGPRWGAVAVFGLVHGFGLAGPLQDLGLSQGALAGPLLAFNLGVETGQLAVVLVLLPLALRLRAAPAYRRWIVRPASATVAALALGWTLERAFALPLASAWPALTAWLGGGGGPG